jgi:hypothetical protein
MKTMHPTRMMARLAAKAATHRRRSPCWRPARTGSEDGTVKKSSVHDGNLIDKIEEKIGAITRILWAEEKLLVIGTALGIGMIWDLIRHRVRAFLFDPSLATSAVRAVTYSAYEIVRLRLTNQFHVGDAKTSGRNSWELPPHSGCRLLNQVTVQAK